MRLQSNTYIQNASFPHQITYLPPRTWGRKHWPSKRRQKPLKACQGQGSTKRKEHDCMLLDPAETPASSTRKHTPACRPHQHQLKTSQVRGGEVLRRHSHHPTASIHQVHKQYPNCFHPKTGRSQPHTKATCSEKHKASRSEKQKANQSYHAPSPSLIIIKSHSLRRACLRNPMPPTSNAKGKENLK